LLGRCSLQLSKSRGFATTVFTLEHYFASKLFFAVRDTFNNAYRDNEVHNKTTIHGLVTKSRDPGSVCLCQVLKEWKKQLKLRPFLFQVQRGLEQLDTAALSPRVCISCDML
jgi:hypothetical protein